MIIPIDELDADTLFNVAEQFVLREGTDYGSEEVDLSQKVEQVISQLKSGQIVLVYSELHETVNIMPRDQLSQVNEENEPSNFS